MSIREDAINKNITPLFEACAAQESVGVESLMAGVASGEIAITKNNNHNAFSFPKSIVLRNNHQTNLTVSS